jgi:hypothetical protein
LEAHSEAVCISANKKTTLPPLLARIGTQLESTSPANGSVRYSGTQDETEPPSDD